MNEDFEKNHQSIEEETTFCHSCGSTMSVSDIFCGMCGAKQPESASAIEEDSAVGLNEPLKEVVSTSESLVSTNTTGCDECDRYRADGNVFCENCVTNCSTTEHFARH